MSFCYGQGPHLRFRGFPPLRFLVATAGCAGFTTFAVVAMLVALSQPAQAQPSATAAPKSKAKDAAAKKAAAKNAKANDAPAETDSPDTPPDPASPEKGASEKLPPEKEDAPDDEKLPLLDQMELPSFARLIQGPAIDWIVMFTDKVIQVEPLYPRPGVLESMQKKIADTLKKGLGPAQSEEVKRSRQKMYYLPLTLLDGEEREYKLHMQFIKQIIYYEDLMLRRIDRLLDERRVREAFELLVALENRQTNWPGITDRQERLLFTEALVKFEGRQLEPALALLEELHQRNRNFNGISGELGKVIDELIAEAVKQQDFRRARFFLRRLEKRQAKHPVAERRSAELQADARKAIVEAARADEGGQAETALNLIEQAARIWPETPELLSPFNRIAKRFQRLRVGVVDLPHASPEGEFPSAGDVRYQQLTQTKLFQPARIDNKLARYETRYFEEWEPTELGHSLLVRLRQHRSAWESLPAPSAGAIAASLATRLDPRSPYADERFSSYVDSMTIVSPFELIVNFRQVPLRPEALLAFLAGDASSGRAASLEKAVAGFPAVGDAGSPPPAVTEVTYPFHVRVRSPQQVAYRRTIAEARESLDRHVDELVEIKYDSHDKAMQALFRGEVSMLPKVPAWAVKKFEGRGDFFTHPFAVPRTHLLQFNPQSQPMGNRTLRRALVYGLNRPKILEQVFLHEPPGRLGRSTSAPFPVTSYAFNPLVEPHGFDATLAFSLAAAARKELGGKLRPLTLVCPADADMQEAARQIIGQWERIGLQVTLQEQLENATAASSDWDIVYTSTSMVEPLVEMWRCLTLTRNTDVRSLTRLPVWLRHELLELDQAGDWNVAQELLHKLHRQIWAEVYLIPLWELNEFMVTRKQVRGISARPMHAYQGIERWTLDPWYLKDL